MKCLQTTTDFENPFLEYLKVTEKVEEPSLLRLDWIGAIREGTVSRDRDQKSRRALIFHIILAQSVKAQSHGSR